MLTARDWQSASREYRAHTQRVSYGVPASMNPVNPKHLIFEKRMERARRTYLRERNWAYDPKADRANKAHNVALRRAAEDKDVANRLLIALQKQAAGLGK